MKNKTPPVTKSYKKPELKRAKVEDGTKWDCQHCHKDTFGLFKEGVLHVKYRERDVFIQAKGEFHAYCRNCRAVNVLLIKDSGVELNILPENNSLTNSDR